MKYSLILTFLLLGNLYLCAQTESKPKEESQTKQDKKEENTCTQGDQTCGKETQKIEYPSKVKYEENFRQKGNEREEYENSFTKESNYTDYYDFSLDEEEIEHIKKVRLTLYPTARFVKNNQGNFLHFMKVAYDKKLPVYFTKDMMLYPLNENIQKNLFLFLEEIFLPLFTNFFQKMVDYIDQLINSDAAPEITIKLSHALIYYGCGLEFLSGDLKTAKFPSERIEMSIKSTTELAKKYAENEFFIMLKKKKIDTGSLVPPPLWMSSKKLFNIYTAIRWYQIARLDTADEMNNIWLLGKLLQDSGLSQEFNKIREMIKYFIGEDRQAPNFLEIYEFGLKKFNFSSYELNKDQISKLNKALEMLPIGTYAPDLPFLTEYFLYSKEHYETFKYERESTSFLFNYPFTVESWVINKLIDPTKSKLLTSIEEFADTIHQASAYRDITIARYKGDSKYGSMLEFRDNVDLEQIFEKSKYEIKQSMERNPEKWQMNLINHYHLLMYKCSRNIENNSDPVFKLRNYKGLNYFASVGAYTHFKREINILDKVLRKPDTGGSIPEVVLEPHTKAFSEMQVLYEEFSKKIIEYTKYAEEKLGVQFKDEQEEFVYSKENITKALHIIIKGIDLQASGQLDDTWRKNLQKAFYFNSKEKKWDGWYTKVYTRRDNDQKNIFNFSVWTYKLIGTPEIKDLKFPGAMVYVHMRFPHIGLIVVEDKWEGQKKLLLFSTYHTGQYLSSFTNKSAFKEMADAVINRK